jgi:hypothetical protein
VIVPCLDDSRNFYRKETFSDNILKYTISALFEVQKVYLYSEGTESLKSNWNKGATLKGDYSEK